MTWFYVDDRLHSHPKWLAAPPGARALWVSAGSWCASNLTDGRLPRAVVGTLGSRTRDARALVACGLWSETADGWEFRDWLDYQKSREEVESKRAQARDRMQRVRGQRKQGDGSREQDANVRENFAGSAREVRSTQSRPSPTHPNPLLGEVVRRLSRGRTTTTTDDDIAQWREWAGPVVDLEAECRGWLLHNADVDLDNPRAALKGWLERARTRTAPPAPAGAQPVGFRPTPVPSRPTCPRHPGQPLPPACPSCAREAAPPPPGWRALADPTDNPSTEEEPPW